MDYNNTIYTNGGIIPSMSSEVANQIAAIHGNAYVATGLSVERDIAGYALSLNVSESDLVVFAAHMRAFIGTEKRMAEAIYTKAIQVAYELREAGTE